MYITTKSCWCHIQKTTLGWKLLDQCNNRTEQWTPLKDLKEANTVELAEFVSERGVES